MTAIILKPGARWVFVMIEYLLLSSLFFQELHLDSEPLEKFLSALQVGGEIAVHVGVCELTWALMFWKTETVKIQWQGCSPGWIGSQLYCFSWSKLLLLWWNTGKMYGPGSDLEEGNSRGFVCLFTSVCLKIGPLMNKGYGFWVEITSTFWFISVCIQRHPKLQLTNWLFILFARNNKNPICQKCKEEDPSTLSEGSLLAEERVSRSYQFINLSLITAWSPL